MRADLLLPVLVVERRYGGNRIRAGPRCMLRQIYTGVRIHCSDMCDDRYSSFDLIHYNFKEVFALWNRLQKTFSGASA
ncbi:hypothetical protein D3C86_1802230 [compost metagenome]